MTNKELFKQAVNEGFMIRMERDAAVIEKDIICSEGHYRKLSEIFGFEVKRPKMKRIGERRAVAAILIAAALLLAGCAAVVYREQIGNFFVNTYETYIKGYFVNNDEESVASIEDFYTLTYVPEGYELVEEKHKVEVAISIWETQDGNQLIFEQSLIHTGHYFLDNENGDSKIIETERYTVYIQNINGSYCCFWSDSNYAFALYLEHEMTIKEIEMIIEGIIASAK